MQGKTVCCQTAAVKRAKQVISQAMQQTTGRAQTHKMVDESLDRESVSNH